MKKSSLLTVRNLSVLTLALGLPFSASANVTLPPIFSAHAVLQKTAKVPIWGKADPDEAVTVSLDGQKAEAKAGADGKWQAVLDLKDKGPGPYEMVVEGKNKLTIPDVLVGEVWVCSGQSNMEFGLKRGLGSEEEIAGSANPLLRQFLVKKATSVTPLEQCDGEWIQASPQTSAGFTAVGYYFGKTVQNDLKVPVGLIHTSWGGTPSEAWTSAQALSTNPDLKAKMDKSLDDVATFPKRLEAYLPKYQEWLTANNRADHPAADVSIYTTGSTADWKKVTLPGPLAKAGLPDAGAVWVRKTVTVDPLNAGKDLVIELGTIRDFDAFYWNGEKTNQTVPEVASPYNRRYVVPGKSVKAGENVIALRVFTPSNGAGVALNYTPFKIGGAPLNGEWLGKEEFALPALDAAILTSYPTRPDQTAGLQNTTTCLYNAMINPLFPYAIKGTVWYQGESNAGRAFQYRTAFPMMIQDWRTHWNQGDFPFYFCQLANYMAKKDQPGESAWAELRDAQSSTLSLPNTGMAVLIDIGETEDIHPRNKKDAGQRLAFLALAKDYGRKIPWSGPVYQSIKIDGDKAVLQFTHTDGGLVAKPLPETQVLKSSESKTAPLIKPMPDSQLQGFAICGEDKLWKWADAKIVGETVVVSSPDVPKPIAVRYAWADNPTCNLYNGAGIPASPFRTDDFQLSTFSAKF